jgi:hypothetical protein
MKRRVAALAIGALAALALSAPPASGLTQPGAARAPTAPPSTVASIPQSTVTVTAVPAPGSQANTGGTGYDVALAPGGSVAQTLLVTNHSTDRQLTVGVQAVDARRSDNTITYSATATANTPTAWVASTVGVGVVEPGETLNVPFTVSVPQDAAPGTNAVVGLQVTVQRADSLHGGVPIVNNLPTINVPVSIGVAGTAAPVVAITSVKAKQIGDAPMLEVTVHNSGTVPTTAVGSATTPGSTTNVAVRVAIPAASTRVVYVPWTTFDPALGANVDIELHYGAGDVASWLGTVAPPTVKQSTTATTIDASGNAVPVAGGHSSSFNWKKLLEWLFAIIVALLLLGALVFFANELLRPGAKTSRGPIDVGSLPPLQVTMDPAHTDVLNALVTQVGTLGSAIEHLANRVGVPVAVPPGPPLLTPGGKRRRHGSSRVHRGLGDDDILVERDIDSFPPLASSAPAPLATAAAAAAPSPSPSPAARDIGDINATLRALPDRPLANRPAPPLLPPPPQSSDAFVHTAPPRFISPPASPPPGSAPDVDAVAHDAPRFISPAPVEVTGAPVIADVAPRNIGPQEAPRFIPPSSISRSQGDDRGAEPGDVFDALRPAPEFIAPRSFGPDPYEPPPATRRAQQPPRRRPAFIAPADPSDEFPTEDELDAFIARQDDDQ